MNLLLPLGLLGLLGVAALILIYIIRPNYIQKHISSTFVWKLSLRYRKKKRPLNKLRDILLIICQILIITVCSLIIARPALVTKEIPDVREVIAIVDSSASMRAEFKGQLRFDRAIDGVVELADEVFEERGVVSVIVADNEPHFLAERVEAKNRETMERSLQELVSENMCAYGVSDLDGAIGLCENILLDNPAAEIFVYTDNSYSYRPEGVTIVPVADANEWNFAIVDAYAEMEDNYYTFFVDVASYGRNAEIEINLEVSGANAADVTDLGAVMSYPALISCPEDTVQRVIFRNQNSEIIQEEDENVTVISIDPLYSYQVVSISISEEDSFNEDNNFYIYGGQKELLKVQYASETPNSFFGGVMLVLRSIHADRWDIVFDEVRKGEDPLMEGYDLYIFEHKMPETLPKDGAVLLVNPDSAPAGSGFRVGTELDYRGVQMPLFAEQSHSLLKGLVTDDITVSKFVKLVSIEPAYEELLSCDGSPVLIVKNEQDRKIAVLSFSLHFSSFSLLPEFPVFMNNLLKYFMPATVEGNAFEVNEKVELNARGPVLDVTGNTDVSFYEFPATLSLDLPGTYVLTQETYFGKTIVESIYVRVPARESNIHYEEDDIAKPYRQTSEDTFYRDLLLYFAIASVTLLFIEWWLQARKNMNM